MLMNAVYGMKQKQIGKKKIGGGGGMGWKYNLNSPDISITRTTFYQYH